MDGLVREKASERTGNGELIPLVHLYIVPGLNPPGLTRLSDPHSAPLEVNNRLHALVRNQSRAPPLHPGWFGSPSESSLPMCSERWSAIWVSGSASRQPALKGS